MRARPDILPHLIATRMQRWLEIVRCPILDRRIPTWKARRNFRSLVRKYPQLAARLGYSEALSYPSPLHGLRSPFQQQEPQQAPPEPRQEFPCGLPNTDVTSPAPAERFVERIAASQPEPPASGVPRIFCLEDEVL